MIYSSGYNRYPICTKWYYYRTESKSSISGDPKAIGGLTIFANAGIITSITGVVEKTQLLRVIFTGYLQPMVR